MGVAEQRHNELYCPTCEQAFDSGERCPTDNTRLVRITAPTDALIGRELDGRYTIVEKLGQGGMGAVYRGTQHSVGREVAIKVVAPALVSERDVIKRFLREAKLASRLAHPNAVAVLDFGQTDDNMFYLVMELVGGRTLDRLLAEVGTLPPARLVRIGVQICDALEGAHSLQIVHRDLKPQNVMVLATGRDLVKVLDFGIAKSLTPHTAGTTVTNAGALLGTPAFMPPELVTGGACDARADLYSLGCVLFVAATGRLPFEASTITELIAMHACEPAPPAEGLPPRLQAVIGRLLEKDPALRFPSAAAARDALEASMVGAVEEPEPERDRGTALGWSGQHTVRAKSAPMPPTPAPGRIITPLSSARIGARSIPEDQQELIASSATLLADAIEPVPPPEAQKSRRGLGLALALGGIGALAVGAIVFVALRGGAREPDPSPAAAPKAESPAPPAAQPAPPPAQPIPAAAQPTPPPAPPTPPPRSPPAEKLDRPPVAPVITPAPATTPARPTPPIVVQKPKPDKPLKPTTPNKEPPKDPPRKPVTVNPGVE